MRFLLCCFYAWKKSNLILNLSFVSEKCKTDYVLFQAASTIQESLLREWSILSAEDIESLRSFLLRYITQHIRLVLCNTLSVSEQNGGIFDRFGRRNLLESNDFSHIWIKGEIILLLFLGNEKRQSYILKILKPSPCFQDYTAKLRELPLINKGTLHLRNFWHIRCLQEEEILSPACLCSLALL